MIQAPEFELGDEDFARIRARVREQAGMGLTESKRTLVIARLSKIVRARRLGSFATYLDLLEKDGSAAEEQEFINALTTNLTRFWREEHHFEHLTEHVRGIIASRSGTAQAPRLRIWSAGCSTGQEPYTIALTLLTAFPELKYWDFKILATDIDTAVLARAVTGLYPASEINDLSPERAALFERMEDGRVRIPAAAASLVSFRTLNLLADWPMKGKFEAIFCRNVTIYFDRATQAEIFTRLGEVLAPGGMLYIGHSENLGAHAAGFRVAGKTVYQARQGQRARSAA